MFQVKFVYLFPTDLIIQIRNLSLIDHQAIPQSVCNFPDSLRNQDSLDLIGNLNGIESVLKQFFISESVSFASLWYSSLA